MCFRLVDDKRKLIPQVWFLSNLRFLGDEIEAGDCKSMKTEQFMVTVKKYPKPSRNISFLSKESVNVCWNLFPADYEPENSDPESD